MGGSMRVWAFLAIVAAGGLAVSPEVLARPLEAADPAELSREVADQVERLVSDIAARDPELAQEIERQRELCLRDLDDGRLDHEGFTRDIEQFREVREVMERALGLEAGPEGRGLPEDMGERPELFQPTPEMIERMQTEMDRWLTEHPEMAEYAQAEFEHFSQEHFGPEMGEHDGFERFGEPASIEQARDMFEQWAAEGRTAEEMEHAQEMFREYERNFEQYREMFERDYDNVLQQQADFQSGSGPSPSGEVLVRTDNHFADHNGDLVPENHPHEIYRHSDSTCHDHATQGPAGC